MAMTDEEKRILDEWPVITREELSRINQRFPRYLFWRKEKWDGGILWRIACSHCGKRLELTGTPQSGDAGRTGVSGKPRP